MKIYASLSRFSRFSIQRLATITLVALTWSIPAFCGEIHDAARKGDLQKAKMLLKDNPEFISSRNDDGWTPLYEAVLEDYKDIVEWLLINKADVNIRDNDGFTPLHWVAMTCRKDMAIMLLADKADGKATDNTGRTPLHKAAESGCNFGTNEDQSACT
jgi:ankyrin repeat protein